MRVSWEEIYMNFAHLIASRSYDPKLKVGCVIVSDDYRDVLSIGFNGNAPGLPNKRDSEEQGKSGFIHAELNAAIRCQMAGNTPKRVFITHQPCGACSKALIALGGVTHVYYKVPYPHDLSCFELFKQTNIKLISLQERITL